MSKAAKHSDSRTAAQDGLRVVDVRAMEWREPDPDEPFGGSGVKVKVLTRDPAGWWVTQLSWIPTWLGPIGDHRPERHYHRHVHEWAFVVNGELPLLEYESLVAGGVPVLLQEDYFLDRLPGPSSAHGFDSESTRQRVHAMMLATRDGPGTFFGEPGFYEQNVKLTDADLADGRVPPDADLDSSSDQATFTPLNGPGVLRSTDTVTIVDTREIPWETPAATEPLSSVLGATVKVVSRFPDGRIRAQLVHLPTNTEAVISRRSAYVLEGALTLASNGQTCSQDFMIESAGDAAITGGPTGCVYLEWHDERRG